MKSISSKIRAKASAVVLVGLLFASLVSCRLRTLSGVRDSVLPVPAEHAWRSPLIDEAGPELLVKPGSKDDAWLLVEGSSEEHLLLDVGFAEQEGEAGFVVDRFEPVAGTGGAVGAARTGQLPDHTAA